MPRVVVPVTDLTPPKASLTTALAGANNDLVFTAMKGGPGGNSIRVQYIVGAGTNLLSVAVEGYDILVTLATTAGASTSTATQVKAAVDANSDASRLVTIANAAANDGTGIVVALALTALAGGALEVTPPTEVDGDTTNGHYLRGNDGLAWLEARETGGVSRTVTIEYGPLYAPLVDVAGTVVTVPANATRLIPLTDVAAYNQNVAGDVYFTPSVSTTVKFRSYKLVRVT